MNIEFLKSDVFLKKHLSCNAEMSPVRIYRNMCAGLMKFEQNINYSSCTLRIIIGNT